MKKFFFTTNDKGIFYILTESARINLSKKNNKKIETKKIKKKMPSISFYFFLLRIIILGRIFDTRSFGYIKYKNFSVGKHALAETRRFFVSYKNFMMFFLIRAKMLFSAARIVDTALSIKDRSEGIFIDHIVYLNGLYFEVFYKNKKIIYANGFPKGFFVIDGKKNFRGVFKKTDSIFKIDVPKRLSKNQKKLAKSKISETLKNPKKIPYLSNANFKKLDDKIDFSKVSHVVYAHSFTDAQLAYGYDGFSDTRDWLIYTIEKLSKLKSKIIIKGHPNFYNFKFGEAAMIDNSIFQKIIKRFSKNNNLIFLNRPIRNNDLLKKLSKKTILITHHGTTIFDANLKKFKIISSSETFYRKNVKISNTWNNISAYSSLLEKNYHQLSKHYKKILNVSYGLYFNRYNLYGKKFFIKIIKKYININKKNFQTKHMQKNIDEINFNKSSNYLCKELSSEIENLKLF